MGKIVGLRISKKSAPAKDGKPAKEGKPETKK